MHRATVHASFIQILTVFIIDFLNSSQYIYFQIVSAMYLLYIKILSYMFYGFKLRGENGKEKY